MIKDILLHLRWHPRRLNKYFIIKLQILSEFNHICCCVRAKDFHVKQMAANHCFFTVRSPKMALKMAFLRCVSIYAYFSFFAILDATVDLKSAMNLQISINI